HSSDKAQAHWIAEAGGADAGDVWDLFKVYERCHREWARWSTGQHALQPEDDRALFEKYQDLLHAPPLTFAIQDFWQNDGINVIGGLSGHGKTLVLLSITKAILTGKPLWGHFPVNWDSAEPRKVLYLIPECARTPFVHRLKVFGLLPFCEHDLLLVR